MPSRARNFGSRRIAIKIEKTEAGLSGRDPCENSSFSTERAAGGADTMVDPGAVVTEATSNFLPVSISASFGSSSSSSIDFSGLVAGGSSGV
uniref:Uncharacterized protein n=1 Tax=Anopheles minimus TaxID=112268 RepID=A0A182WK53_9DIPT